MAIRIVKLPLKGEKISSFGHAFENSEHDVPRFYHFGTLQGKESPYFSPYGIGARTILWEYMEIRLILKDIWTKIMPLFAERPEAGSVRGIEGKH